MSWGERSCEWYGYCHGRPCEPTMSTCRAETCEHYEQTPGTKTDAEREHEENPPVEQVKKAPPSNTPKEGTRRERRAKRGRGG